MALLSKERRTLKVMRKCGLKNQRWEWSSTVRRHSKHFTQIMLEKKDLVWWCEAQTRERTVVKVHLMVERLWIARILCFGLSPIRMVTWLGEQGTLFCPIMAAEEDKREVVVFAMASVSKIDKKNRVSSQEVVWGSLVDEVVLLTWRDKVVNLARKETF